MAADPSSSPTSASVPDRRPASAGPVARATLPDGPPLLTWLLRAADDNLVLSQRLGELIASMPELEEDIAVANVALDHLGQARNLYQYATELDPAGRTEDQFAMTRSEREFLNAVLVEQPNGDFAVTMVRQLLVDAYQMPLYQALTGSIDERLAGIAAKAVKEARYHLEHSSGWVVTLGDGTSESNRRAQAAVDELWPFRTDLFAADEVEHELATDGVVPDPASLRPTFDETVATVLSQANLTVPSDPYERIGGRTGYHTAHLGHLLPEMQWLHQSQPGAEW
ncbi:MAG: 1,2-phenylacetyl-CoA epoxidase subunit PaaC [Actinomycetota bacterium]